MTLEDPFAGVKLQTNTPMDYNRGEVAPNCASLLLALWASGAYPAYRSVNVKQADAAGPLDPGGRLIRTTLMDDGRRSEIYAGDGWLLAAEQYWEAKPGGAVQIGAVVVALDDDVAGEVAERFRKTVRLAETDVATMNIAFTYMSPQGGHEASRRTVQVPGWDDIARNYPASVRGQLGSLVTLQPDDVHGRLLLLNGPPGTGKTTFLRALMQSWRDWCEPQFIMDPERLLSDAGYLMSAVLAASEHDWRLLILEDTGELLGGSAKHDTGQSLSRLLNIADGLPGQGLNLLIAITSNEDITRFHPAVVRPGRCLAQIEVPAMPHREASEWIGDAIRLDHRDYTLAELITLRDGGEISTEDDAPTGQYM